jgi:hypothetical protein
VPHAVAVKLDEEADPEPPPRSQAVSASVTARIPTTCLFIAAESTTRF